MPSGPCRRAMPVMRPADGKNRPVCRGAFHPRSSRAKSERGIWQRRYWEHTLSREADLRQHIDYVHFNPVKHGWVGMARDWPYSTFHRYVGRGDYPVDWADRDFRADVVGEPN